MAIDYVSAINSASFVSPVDTSGTSNVTGNVRALQRLRALADTQAVNFQQTLYEDEELYNIFSTNDLLSLDSQSLDLLNGVNPTTASTSEDALDSAVQTNSTQLAATQAATIAADIAVGGTLNLDSIQRENLTSIINEFANAPFDQTTFIQIQNALVAANINPQQISLQAILQEVFSGALPNSYYSNTRSNEHTVEVETEAA